MADFSRTLLHSVSLVPYIMTDQIKEDEAGGSLTPMKR
jgi:hypothetical protein